MGYFKNENMFGPKCTLFHFASKRNERQERKKGGSDQTFIRHEKIVIRVRNCRWKESGTGNDQKRLVYVKTISNQFRGNNCKKTKSLLHIVWSHEKEGTAVNLKNSLSSVLQFFKLFVGLQESNHKKIVTYILHARSLLLYLFLTCFLKLILFFSHTK